MLLSEYLDVSKLAQHINDGYVNRQYHQTLPLMILCYSRKTTYEQMWDDVTSKTRGLIVHRDTGELVARPFEKFHNIDTTFLPETHVYNLPAEPPVVTEKLDGNLAIYYRLGDYEGIASKGSFHSPHAEWGTKWFKDNWNLGNFKDYDSHTPVFEQICEDIEHHVVHYGSGHQGLYLLAMIDKETGEEMSRPYLNNWANHSGIPMVQHYHITVGEVISENRPNTEGYVLTWPRPGQTPFRVKVKHADFLRLQKIKNGMTRKHILEMLTAGQEIPDYTSEDTNLHSRIHGIVNDLRQQYFTIAVKASALCKGALCTCTTRKEFAEFFLAQDREIAPVCFKMLDQEDHKPAIWKIVKQRTKNVPDTSETGEETDE